MYLTRTLPESQERSYVVFGICSLLTSGDLSVLTCAWLIDAEILHGGILAAYVVACSRNLNTCSNWTYIVPQNGHWPNYASRFRRGLLKSSLPKDRNVAPLATLPSLISTYSWPGWKFPFQACFVYANVVSTHVTNYLDDLLPPSEMKSNSVLPTN